MPETPSQRVTDVAGHHVRFDVEPALLDDLGDGDWFIGPGVALYEVTTPAVAHPRGWTDVVNLSISDAEADVATASGADAAAGPRDGFFAYSIPVTVDRVLAVLGISDETTTGLPAGLLAGAGQSIVATLLERWVSTDRGPVRYDRGSAPASLPPPDGRSV